LAEEALVAEDLEAGASMAVDLAEADSAVDLAAVDLVGASAAGRAWVVDLAAVWEAADSAAWAAADLTAGLGEED
jgi:hypothetical protein